MANKLYEESYIADIANAIREKNGSSNTYKVSQMGSAIRAISVDTGEDSAIPTYHYVECGRVIDNIRTFKATHPKALIFGVVSDSHINNTNSAVEARSKTSIKHAAFALEMVGAMAQCDFIANLGDNCEEQHIDPTITSSPCGLVNAQYSMNTLKPAFNRIPHYNLVGNHDKTNDTQMQHDLISAYNDFDVYSDTKIRGFGYKDYADKKVRLIVLNTCDYLYRSGGCALSYEQKDFLMRALDLSAKTDASQWQILLLSHIPLDWNGGDYNFYTDLQAILNAYEDGTTASVTVNSSYALNETPSNYATYSSGKLIYNYSGKNSAKIIANVHGHLHNNKTGKIANTDILRVSTVNASPDGNSADKYSAYGDYAISSTEFAKLAKSSGTVKDTAVTFYCIDLDERIVYTYGYGADIDRVISYKSATVYSIVYNLTNVTSSNAFASAVEGTRFMTELSINDDATLDRVVVTMGGVDVTATYYKDGVIDIGAVNGDIIITAVATIPLWSETVSDIAVAIRSLWQTTNGSPTLTSSNAEAAIGVTTANVFGYTDRESKSVYVMPVNAKARDVEVNVTDGTACTYRFIGLKYNGNNFTTVFTTSKQDAGKHSWTAGTISHILINLERKDGTSWAWGYNDNQISVTFTNGGTASGGDNGNSGSDSGGSTVDYDNIIDTVGTEDNVRLRSGGNTAEASAFASNYFEAHGGDVIRVYFPGGNRESIPSNGMYCVLYSADKSTVMANYDGEASSTVLKNTTTTGYEIHIPADVSCSFARVAGAPAGAHTGWVVTVNEEIQ